MSNPKHATCYKQEVLYYSVHVAHIIIVGDNVECGQAANIAMEYYDD